MAGCPSPLLAVLLLRPPDGRLRPPTKMKGRALRSVKAIFCEKPLATTVEDTDRMLEACERNNVVISVDHTRRFLPIWRYTKEQCAPLPRHALCRTRRPPRWPYDADQVGMRYCSGWLTRVPLVTSST